ncbi:hypothetical protein RRG08_059162 [Elysia crispata]|uniref:Uncharacterized protein n=1 Tax=Elysia crispata TaxID=231223 RepID=A0AAE1B130_9GAST|nr:hypothetical protein RRG08_059162 [Elysia crispata]
MLDGAKRGAGVTVRGRCGEMLDRGAGGYSQREMWGDVGWSKTRGGGYCQREMWGDREERKERTGKEGGNR